MRQVTANLTGVKYFSMPLLIGCYINLLKPLQGEI
jgi:hypothetical protein